MSTSQPREHVIDLLMDVEPTSIKAGKPRYMDGGLLSPGDRAVVLSATPIEYRVVAIAFMEKMERSNAIAAAAQTIADTLASSGHKNLTVGEAFDVLPVADVARLRHNMVILNALQVGAS